VVEGETKEQKKKNWSKEQENQYLKKRRLEVCTQNSSGKHNLHISAD
jgi:hypothetical protein